MCALVYDLLYLKHLTGYGHPERKERCLAIWEALAPLNLPLIHPRKASREEVLLCHTAPYLDLVALEVLAADFQGNTMLSTGDVTICPDSFETALLAVGGALTAVDAVMQERAQRIFCPVRPPGHHACESRGMGFCLFNNVAVAARYAQKQHGIKRALIVDWDVHHGNGTQEIFYRDPSIFYFSTHQALHYPFTGEKKESGAGTILNCPILGGKESRLEVLKAFRTQLVEAQRLFQPELVFISAGFDGHACDPLGGFNLTEADFAELTHIVCTIANQYAKGRVISVLEGGYYLPSLASSSLAHVQALNQ